MNETVSINLSVEQPLQAIREITGAFQDFEGKVSAFASSSGVFDSIFSGLDMVESGIGAVQSIVSNFGMLNDVFSILAAHPILLVIGAIVTALMLLQQETGFLTEIMNMLIPVFESLGAIFAPVGEAFTMLSEALASALAPILPTIASLFTGIVAALMPLMGPIHQLISLIIPVLVGLLHVLMTPLIILANIFAVILKVAVDVIVGVLTLLVGILMIVINWFGSMVGAIRDGAVKAWQWVRDTFNKIKDGIRDAISNAINFVLEMPGKILSALSGAGRWLVDIGKNMIQGLLDGAKSLLGNIGKFFLDIVPGWIRGPFEKALGIHSPSRIFMGYGKDILRGLANGIASSAYLAENAIGGLATDLSSDFRASVESGDMTSGTANALARPAPVINQYNTNYTEFDQDQALAELTWLYNRARS